MRRCDWCGVRLRWWQLSWCRVCYWYIENDVPFPPCAQGSRTAAAQDHFWGDKRRSW